jgi:DNA-directed RNA polymerase subunit alpha
MQQKSWKGLIRPKRLEVEKETLTPFYGKFSAEPLERGFGITIGNSLRRILLSSLQGAAITSFKIDGVLHEFSTIPGVKEDVTEIILNLKEVRLKLHTEGPKTIRIKTEGQKVLKAGDIQTGDAVEILNPDQYLATLSKDAKLSMEMTVKMGRGYVPAERNKEEGQPLGTTPIDAIFAPIRKVNYTVTNARVTNHRLR